MVQQVLFWQERLKMEAGRLALCQSPRSMQQKLPKDILLPAAAKKSYMYRLYRLWPAESVI
jgi:hypothetical protein